jgi:hypothetical protein
MSVLEAVLTRPAAGEEKERLSSVPMADSKKVTEELESKKNYPYSLRENPFAVAPKTIRDGSVIFGGDIHRTAKDNFDAWLKRIQLESATDTTQARETCPLLIVHGDQGTGKT